MKRDGISGCRLAARKEASRLLPFPRQSRNENPCSHHNRPLTGQRCPLLQE